MATRIVNKVRGSGTTTAMTTERSMLIEIGADLATARAIREDEAISWSATNTVHTNGLDLPQRGVATSTGDVQERVAPTADNVLAV